MSLEHSRFLAGQPSFGIYDESNEPILIHEVEVTEVASPPPSIKFRRGDVDGQGTSDISDAVRIFGHLFLGNPAAIDCEDAADTDDSGALDLTDGVYLLNYLFAGNAPPPAPGVEDCGEDPTDDELDCAVGCP